MKKRQRRKGCALIRMLICVFGILLFALAGVKGIHDCFERLDQKKAKEVSQAVERIPDAMHRQIKENFYYNILGTDEEKVAYEEILAGIENEEEKITVHLNDPERVNRIYQMVLMDYPKYFWCTGNSETAGYESEDSSSILTPEYSCYGEERAKKKEELKKAAAELKSRITILGDSYETIKSVFEEIIRWTEYELDSPDNQNIYSVLVNRKSVCAGYAKTTKYLLDMFGIPCIYVVGSVSGQGAHAWNIVECQGQYYHVDTTWGEPVFLREEGAETYGSIVYDYLCCSDEELFKTHTESEEYDYPACVSEENNYYRLNGMYYETADAEDMRKAMRASIQQKKESVSFKFHDRTQYENAHELLFDSLLEESVQYLGKLYGLDVVTYSYEEAEESNRLTVYWKYGGD